MVSGWAGAHGRVGGRVGVWVLSLDFGLWTRRADRIPQYLTVDTRMGYPGLGAHMGEKVLGY